MNPDSNQWLALPTNVGFLANDINLERITELVGPTDEITPSESTGTIVYRYGDMKIHVDPKTDHIIMVDMPIAWLQEGLYARAEKAMNAFVDKLVKDGDQTANNDQK